MQQRRFSITPLFTRHLTTLVNNQRAAALDLVKKALLGPTTIIIFRCASDQELKTFYKNEIAHKLCFQIIGNWIQSLFNFSKTTAKIKQHMAIKSI